MFPSRTTVGHSTAPYVLWRRYYVTRHDADDTQGMADAAAILAKTQNWPATRRLRGPRGDEDVLSQEAALAARGELPPQMRERILINCTDAIDARRRPGETNAEGLERIKREARAANNG